MINQELLMKLAALALQYGPSLVNSVSELIKNYGEPVDAERYERALETLRKDPEGYFGDRRPDDTEPKPEEPKDITKVEHATQDAAIEVAKANHGHYVIAWGDGTFRVWPMGVGPVPGEVVWQP